MKAVQVLFKNNEHKKYYKFKNEDAFKLDEGESAITYIEQEEDETGYASTSIATTIGRQKGNKDIQIIRGKVTNFSNIKNLNGVEEITYEEYKNELTRLFDTWNEFTEKINDDFKIFEWKKRYGLYWILGNIKNIPVILFDSYETIMNNEQNRHSDTVMQ